MATEELVRQRLAEEIEVQQAAIPKTEALLPAAQTEYDQVWDEWSADARKHPDDETPRELLARVDAASRRLFGLYDSIHHHKQRIVRLSSPMELQERMQKTERINALRERSTMAKETAKDQGVPAVYLNEAGNFRIGMDARLKSDLVNAALKIESAEALHSFTPAQAEKLLKARGWMKFLDRKKEIIAAKEQKAAEAAKVKEERARERAAEKEKKAAEKAEAKAKADAEKEAKAAEKKAADAEKKASSGKAQSKSDQDGAQREAKASN
jgi:colicin import membrane protein